MCFGVQLRFLLVHLGQPRPKGLQWFSMGMAKVSFAHLERTIDLYTGHWVDALGPSWSLVFSSSFSIVNLIIKWQIGHVHMHAYCMPHLSTHCGITHSLIF